MNYALQPDKASRVLTRVPGRSSSVPRVATSSPSPRSPNTSVRIPQVAPSFTSTHSTFPSRTRTTNVRSVVRATAEVGTKRVGSGRPTGQSASGNIPGASFPELFATSSSTGIVRVFTSTECAILATVAVKISPGKAGTVKLTRVPAGIAAVKVSGTGRTSLSRRTFSIRTIGTVTPGPPTGPTSAPGWTFRSGPAA